MLSLFRCVPIVSFDRTANYRTSPFLACDGAMISLRSGRGLEVLGLVTQQLSIQQSLFGIGGLLPGGSALGYD